MSISIPGMLHILYKDQNTQTHHIYKYIYIYTQFNINIHPKYFDHVLPFSEFDRASPGLWRQEYAPLDFEGKPGDVLSGCSVWGPGDGAGGFGFHGIQGEISSNHMNVTISNHGIWLLHNKHCEYFVGFHGIQTISNPH